jgi:glycerophosphoryl diester phosphodiesterase
MLRRLAPLTTITTALVANLMAGLLTGLLTGLAIVSPGTATATVVGPTATQAQVVNVGHRGASAYAPENTIAAFNAAAARRADMFEFDVQETRDHQLVLIHDTTLGRTTDAEELFPDRAPWRVGDFTLAEIRRLDAGSRFGAQYAGVRVPTLEEALHAMQGSGLGALLEVKAPERYPGIEGRIAGVLCRNPYWLISDTWRRRLVVQGFDWGSMHRFHSLLPGVPIGLLGTPAAEQLPELATFADEINPPYPEVSASYVARVHELGMQVLTWTIDDPAVMRQMIATGVDGIITNKPDMLAQVLGSAPRQAA